MIDDISNEKRLSFRFTTVALGHFMSVLAAFSILTFISLNFGYSFSTYKVICLIIFILVSVPFGFAYYRLKDVEIKDKKVLYLLVIVGLLCATFAVVSHRISEDDYFYTPNIVYALDHPDEPLGYEIHFIDGGENCKPTTFSSGGFEYSQGAIAALSGIEFLSIYYFLIPALVSFLIPFALFYALSYFSDDAMESVLSVIITLGVVLLLGETMRTFGNYSITRTYQGKTVFLALGIPTFIGSTLRFFKSPSLSRWGFLFVIATAMVGASFSSVPLISALALVLGIAIFYCSGLKWKTIPTYLIYFSSLIFVAMFAIFLFTNSVVTQLGVDSPHNAGWPITFWGHLNFMIDKARPVTPIVFILSTIGAVIFTSGKQRRFLVAWMVALIVLFLNPIIAPLVIRYLTSSNIYWRLFYVFPFPLVLSITVLQLIKKARHLPNKTQIILSALMMIVLVGAHFLPSSTSAFKYKTTIKFPPEYKLPPRVDVVREIYAQAPEGPMLTTPLISGMIPMFSSAHPQIHFNSTAFMAWLGSCGKEDLAEIRIGAAEFVHGDVSKLADFQTFLETEGDLVTSIVIRKKVMKVEGLVELLATHQFAHQKSIDNYVLFWK